MPFGMDDRPLRQQHFLAYRDEPRLTDPNMITDVTFPAMMTSPLHTMADIREINSSITEPMRQLYPELAAFDARAVAPRLDIPFFVFQGATDIVTPTECARAFAATVQAPIAELPPSPKPGTSPPSPAPTSSYGSWSNACSPSCQRPPPGPDDAADRASWARAAERTRHHHGCRAG